VPGGGSLGIVGGHAKCQVLGWFGDTNHDVHNGFTGLSAAAAVIETGLTTTSIGISATFTWHANEGIVANYLDDMTFVAIFLTNTAGKSQLRVLPFSNGIPLGSFTYIQELTPPLVAGSTHTLLVKITDAGYEVTVDGGATKIGAAMASTFICKTDSKEFALVKDLTRHGIMAGSRSATFISPGGNLPAFSVS
jgi:hypothetical protein